jgi:natural product precursor
MPLKLSERGFGKSILIKLTMKNFEKLSKAEMKNIKGGGAKTCIVNGAPCNESLQCCSVNCVTTGTGPTGKLCAIS